MTKITFSYMVLALIFLMLYHGSEICAQSMTRDRTMSAMVLANKYFMEKWPDVGKTIITDRERPSNIWTRGVYYEGLMALCKINPDPDNFGGPELTGTALFTYGMAWVINNGLISRKKYLPVVLKAWNSMVTKSLHPDGFLGFVQGTGKEPKDNQPVGYDIVPNFEDFGLG